MFISVFPSSVAFSYLDHIKTLKKGKVSLISVKEFPDGKRELRFRWIGAPVNSTRAFIRRFPDAKIEFERVHPQSKLNSLISLTSSKNSLQ